MANSAALARVQQHKYGSGGKRQEGIYLSLSDLQQLVTFLQTNPNATSQGINHVAFMIGKLNRTGRRPVDGSGTATGRFDELTVEVLPFNANVNPAGAIIPPANFMIETVDGVTTVGALKIPGFPFDNDLGGGGGGNQKTPPPTT
jgi:hypothetical protein